MTKSLELKNRFYISFFLGFLYLLCLLYRPFFILFPLCISVISFFELVNVTKIKDKPFIISAFLFFVFSYYDQIFFFFKNLTSSGILDFNVFNIDFVLMGLLAFMIIPSFFPKLKLKDVSCIFVSMTIISFASRSFLWLFSYSSKINNGWEFISFVLFSIAAADVGAYFFGKYFGKRKINYEISENKTWEGFFGGVVVATIFSLSFAYFTNLFPYITLMQWVLVIININFLSLTGDLYFSKIKRSYKVKDFSKILQKHGGFLDRFDSHIASYIGFFIIFNTIVLWK